MSEAPTRRHEHVQRPTRGHVNEADHSRSSEQTGDTPSPSLNMEYRLVFRIQGLDCAEEVATLKREVGPLVGDADRLAFDVLRGRMMVLESSEQVSADEIREAVRRTGMAAVELREGNEDGVPSDDRYRRIQSFLMIFSGVGVLFGLTVHIWLAGGFWEALQLLGGHDGKPLPALEILAYALAILFGGRYVVVKAWHAARRMRPDMNLLMVIAVFGAMAIGEWFEAAMVTFLFSLSLVLESWSVGRARRAIGKLLDLAPPTVRRRLASGVEEEIPAGDAPVGTCFIVKPGERFPLDGKVMAGTSLVDQAPITGESVPVLKEAGATVYAGTINGNGALKIESTKAADDTTLARIIRLVEQAKGRRAKAEQWVEKFAHVYTPTVIVIAFAVFLIPPLIFGGVWDEWFYRALVLLVIACPCALVISTPVSIVAALASSARQGVLIKGGAYIELPARLNAIAFDKTGTLTLGQPAVVSVIPLNDHSTEELLERAVALESWSTHPLAKAVLDYAADRGIQITPASNTQVLPGKGVTGRYKEEVFWLGSHRYLLERGQETSEVTARTEVLERDGRTVVVIGNDRHVCGLIAMADTVRHETRDVVSALRAAGVEHLVMLTGDNRVTAEAIAREIGIDESHTELLPEDKVTAVEELASKYENVAMVGDGVNDAPAMARASLGIAMGAIGSDAAIETADIALMTDDLSKLPWLISHSRRTLAIIRQNISFSLGVKVAFVILTFAGFATLWGAIAADVGASLLVVMNGLRLLRPKLPVITETGFIGRGMENLVAANLSHGH